MFFSTLILIIMRITNSGRKNNYRLLIEEYLNLHTYKATDCSDGVYRLSAIIAHSGDDVNSGLYTMLLVDNALDTEFHKLIPWLLSVKLFIESYYALKVIF